MGKLIRVVIHEWDEHRPEAQSISVVIPLKEFMQTPPEAIAERFLAPAIASMQEHLKK